MGLGKTNAIYDTISFKSLHRQQVKEITQKFSGIFELSPGFQMGIKINCLHTSGNLPVIKLCGRVSIEMHLKRTKAKHWVSVVTGTETNRTMRNKDKY